MIYCGIFLYLRHYRRRTYHKNWPIYEKQQESSEVGALLLWHLFNRIFFMFLIFDNMANYLYPQPHFIKYKSEITLKKIQMKVCESGLWNLTLISEQGQMRINSFFYLNQYFWFTKITLKRTHLLQMQGWLHWKVL